MFEHLMVCATPGKVILSQPKLPRRYCVCVFACTYIRLRGTVKQLAQSAAGNNAALAASRFQ